MVMDTTLQNCFDLFDQGTCYDHAAQGVRVNAVAPGMTKTPILESVNDEQMEYLNNSISMGRLVLNQKI